MSAGHSEPQVLYSVNNIRAYHVQDGEEHSLTPSGPQTLSLLMVPTASPYADLSNADPASAAPEEDFYLHLHLPPELDQPLPATTQIYHKPPCSYLIPRWDLGPDSGAFTRIEFPSIGRSADKVSQEDVDTFETILAQCTAFLERAPAPHHEKYDPSMYAPGEGYVNSTVAENPHGQIVLIDEENGSVVGELEDGFNVVESSNVRPGSKSMLVPPRPYELLLIGSMHRSCPDSASCTRSRKQHHSRQRFRRIPSHHPTSCLSKVNYCADVCYRIEVDRDRIGEAGKYPGLSS
jgi:spartin